MKKLFAAILALLVPALIIAGSQYNSNWTKPAYQYRSIVTKTASYTATVADDYIKVSTSAGAATITLPAISTLATNGLARKAYKIEKTTSDVNLVTVSPASGNTIDGTTAYIVSKQNDYIVISADSVSLDWVVSYSDDILDVDVTTGAVTVGGAMTVKGVTTSTGAQTFTGAVTGNSTFTLNSSISVNNSSTLSGPVITHGASTVNGPFKAYSTSIGLGKVNYGAATGENTIAVTLAPALTTYKTGMFVVFKAYTATVAGAATLNVNGLGAKSLKKLNNVDPGAGCLEASHVVMAIYDGTNFQLVNPCAN